jgi:hypothetical protein
MQPYDGHVIQSFVDSLIASDKAREHRDKGVSLMNSGRWLILVLCLGLLACCACGSDNGGTGTGGGTDDDGFSQVTAAGVTLKWKVQDSTLMVKVSASTTGWVAVGFDPTNRMQNANLIIGYVSGGDAFIRDDYGSALTSHESDVSGGGSDDVTDKGGTETGGVTEITFSIPLDSGDTRDRPLAEGNTYGVILSRGPNGADDHTTQHAARAATTITL